MSRILRSTAPAIAGAVLGAGLIALTPALAETPPPVKSSPEVEVSPPEIIIESQKSPEYPPAALAARFSGTVTVQAAILSDGRVGEVKVLECSAPHLGFEQASIAAVKQWRFEPATRAGEPIDYEMKFRLNFRGTAADARDPRVTAGTFTPQEGSKGSRERPSSPKSSTGDRSRGR